MSNRKFFVCTVDGCGEEHYSRGYCIKHYYRWKAHGDPSMTKTMVEHGHSCAIQNCDRPYSRKGLCKYHYMKKYRANGYMKEYLKKPKNIERRKEIYHNRKKNPLFATKLRIRNLISASIRYKGYKKNKNTEEILGCSIEVCREHLFNTWEKNYGAKWGGEPYHIDHIVPLATAKNEEDVVRLCHYTNLQMLTPEDNMAKSDKID